MYVRQIQELIFNFWKVRMHGRVHATWERSVGWYLIGKLTTYYLETGCRTFTRQRSSCSIGKIDLLGEFNLEHNEEESLNYSQDGSKVFDRREGEGSNYAVSASLKSQKGIDSLINSLKRKQKYSKERGSR